MKTRDREKAAGKRALAQAFGEVRGGDAGIAQAAREWLTGVSEELAFVCALAGVRPETVRRLVSADLTVCEPEAVAALLNRLRALGRAGEGPADAPS